MRTPQIVAAASRAIVAHGVSGATLERIAAEAGLTRGHVRHYVGNRAHLLDLVIDSAIKPYQARIREISRIRDYSARVPALLDHLFGSDWAPDEDTALLAALLLHAHQDDHLRERLSEYYIELRTWVEKALRSTRAVPQRKVRGAAHAVLCLAYGNTAMAQLALSKPGISPAREAAEALIAKLVSEDQRPSVSSHT